MKIKLDQKIIGYQVLSPSNDAVPPIAPEPEPLVRAIELMTEHVSRPDELYGSTYKIKTPQSEHALYITINDIILNPNTDNEQRRPFEIFINSKNMEHFQWIVALTRVMSAVFRKGGDITFLVEELESVFDPNGGYYKKGGKYIPSLVAELGQVVEQHLKNIGMLKSKVPDEHQEQLIQDKKKEYLEKNSQGLDENGFPKDAQLCHKCSTKAAIMMDGCLTCLSCGESKCG